MSPECVRPACSRKAMNGGRNRGLCHPHHAEFTRRRRAALGPDWLVDTAPLATHIAALRATGFGYAYIAAATGIDRDTISNIARGRTARATAQVAAKIFALPVPAAHEPTRCLVPAIGTRRRLQALCAIGWTNAELALRLGMLETNTSRLRRAGRDVVSADVARRVDVLFRELQLVPGPSTRARSQALKNGWVPPLAWDEDALDDPAAKPAKWSGAPTAFLDRYRDARATGRSNEQIAELFGIKPESLERQLMRYGIYREAS